MPTVSVIVPIYNPRPDYLDEALSSISSQSFKDVEAVVVNDGSKETGFQAVLNKHSSLVKYIEQENEGVAGDHHRECPPESTEMAKSVVVVDRLADL